MKFDIIIKDATKEELISLLGKDIVVDLQSPLIQQTPPPATQQQTPPMPETPPPATQQQTPPPDDNEPQPNELDKNGLPWDVRIHSEPAKINADGSWRAKRGVEKELGKEGIAAIELELRNSLQTPPPATQQQTPPMPETPPPATQQQTPPMPQITADGNQAEAMPDIPAFMDRNNQATPPPATQQQTPPPATNSVDFHTFMTNLSNKMVTKDQNGVPLASPDYLATITAEISNHFGQQLAVITDVSKDQNMIDFAVQILQRDGRW